MTPRLAETLVGFLEGILVASNLVTVFIALSYRWAFLKLDRAVDLHHAVRSSPSLEHDRRPEDTALYAAAGYPYVVRSVDRVTPPESR